MWDFVQGNIGVITTSEREWFWKDMELGISYNQMYVNEVSYFFDCISSRKETFNSVKQSLSVLKLALAANKSCYTNVWERIE